MISLSECAPCRAKRLQEESEREFRERYGMIDLNRPRQLGFRWHPYLGQATAPAVMTPAPTPPATAPGPASPPNDYLHGVAEKFLNFGFGTAFGYPVGLLANVAFKSLRHYRDEAALFTTLAGAVGLASVLLPIEGKFMNTVARISGLLAGSGLADITLPKRDVTDAIAKAI